MASRSSILLDLDRSDFMKLQILEAADSLMKETPLDSLSVTDICRVLDISRQTFYRHFRDKYEIAQWYWNVLGEKYLKETGRTLSWYEGNLFMLEEFVERSSFFLNSFCSDDYNSCREHGCRNRIRFLEETLEEYQGLTLTPDLKFQIEFFTIAESRTIVAWMRSSMPVSPQTLARQIELCVPSDLHRLLDITTY